MWQTKSDTKRKVQTDNKKIRDLIKELRSSAPKCFVTAEEEEETMPGEGLRDWSLAMSGLRE